MSVSVRKRAEDDDVEYLVEYQYGGSKWALPGVFATSRAEASEKVRAIGATGEVLGPIAGGFSITLPHITGIAVIFIAGGIVGVIIGSLL